jgi:hypothetical protein
MSHMQFVHSTTDRAVGRVGSRGRWHVLHGLGDGDSDGDASAGLLDDRVHGRGDSEHGSGDDGELHFD